MWLRMYDLVRNVLGGRYIFGTVKTICFTGREKNMVIFFEIHNQYKWYKSTPENCQIVFYINSLVSITKILWIIGEI